ncbi:MAG: flippase-like domain-containing protein [Gemmatimonadetes bacterium]|nr:flippase-like domain-containing protein [Gemmatimonadota bacterium]NNM06518.1 flippase-like domain-containing protein [Gemmatimonadota bacterium]
MNPRDKGRGLLGWTIGVSLVGGLVALVHVTVGWSSLLSPWLEVDPATLAGAVVLVMISYAVRTVRVHDYFRPITSGEFFRTFRIVLVHNLLNNLLPMRSGEASFPVLMARGFRIPYSKSVPALLYLRVLDLFFVVLLGATGYLLSKGMLAAVLVLLLTPLPYVLFRVQPWITAGLERKRSRLASIAREAIHGLPSSSTLFWRTWVWTGLNWSSKLLVLAWILKAFEPMPFSAALVGSTTGELSSVLPFHGIAGAGTYEAGVLAGLLPMGVALESALKAAVNLHLFVLGVSILAGTAAGMVRLPPNDAGESTGDS